MDAFEQVVSEILWMEGYWVRTSVKVELTKAEKVRIGRPSSPRWELDVVGYNARANTLRVVECKSYIDSTGVQAAGFLGGGDSAKGRYKLFNDGVLREVVFGRLRSQLAERGACNPDAAIKFSLAAGNIRSRDRASLRAHFTSNDWELWDEVWLRSHLKKMSLTGYENQVSAVVAKILLRGSNADSDGPP